MTRNTTDNTPAKGKGDTDAPKKKRAGPLQYLNQVQQEAKKVTWTTWAETRVSALLVLILSTIAMLFFWGVDSLLQFGIRQLLSLGA